MVHFIHSEIFMHNIVRIGKLLDMNRERGAWAKWQEAIHLVNNGDLWADKEKQEHPD